MTHGVTSSSSRTTRWPTGAPCWATLATTREEPARAFYTAVLGWTYRDAGPRQHDWTIAEVDGAVVAGIGALPDAGASAWTLVFATDDVDAAAAAVVNAGGRVLVPPHDVLQGAARSVVARDVGGAQFGLLQAATFAGFTLVNAPGAVAWEDAVVDDPDTTRAFYREMFGYAYGRPAAGEPQFADFASDPAADPWGGIGPDEHGRGSYWCIYFGVPDVDAAVAAATAQGGTVLAAARDVAWGRVARLADPEGAAFGVLSTDWADQPDRSG